MISSSQPVIWIADSTPLIVLAKIGHLHLLTLFADEVLIPQMVVEEVLAGDEDDPGRQALELGFGQRVANPPVPSSVAALRLDAGEEAVLAVAAAKPGSHVVLDDGKARAAAQTLGVPVIGTLGIVARAKAEGHIPAAKPLIRALQSVQFRADDALLRAVLQGLGETWP